VNKILPERPSLIASGINKGENLGDDITYSGTVSAAIEGTILGIPSFAISLVSRNHFRFAHAAAFAARLSGNLLRNGLPKNTLLNVNVPGKKRPKAYKITRMGKRIYGDSVQERVDRWGKKYYTIGGNLPGYADTEDSDFKAIARNLISITPLHLDWTNYASLETLLKRKF
jgi:5'-nucleotidase